MGDRKEAIDVWVRRDAERCVRAAFNGSDHGFDRKSSDVRWRALAREAVWLLGWRRREVLV